MPASRALSIALPLSPMLRTGGTLPLCGALAMALLLGACGSSPTNRAPVEDRGSTTSVSAPVAVAVPVPVSGDPSAVRVLPGAENAGKPGYYTVKPGDTLIRIGLDNGQNWRDIVRWNALANPNQIEVGQVLRVAPPVAGPAPVAVAATPAVSAPAPAANGVATRPVQSGSAAVTPMPPAGSAAPAVASVAANPDDDIIWVWPVGGNVLAGFDDAKNKGVDIGGVAGTPVMAAADGRVVYVGAGLRGYGNLIILKHNNTYLTAYAHNQTLLVKEDQTVHKGQKIAEMGSSDTDRVKLHFEVRRQGKPVDPVKYLPPR